MRPLAGICIFGISFFPCTLEHNLGTSPPETSQKFSDVSAAPLLFSAAILPQIMARRSLKTCDFKPRAPMCRFFAKRSARRLHTIPS